MVRCYTWTVLKILPLVFHDTRCRDFLEVSKELYVCSEPVCLVRKYRTVEEYDVAVRVFTSAVNKKTSRTEEEKRR